MPAGRRLFLADHLPGALPVAVDHNRLSDAGIQLPERQQRIAIGLAFDEFVDSTIANDISKYTVNGSAAAVSMAALRADNKTVVLSLSDDSHVAVAPRFTGALILDAPSAPDAYACLRIRLHDGRELRYTDVRRLGTVALLSAEAFAEWSGALGPEPLDPTFTAERFSACFRGSKQAIKTVLMDQSRLAGVGNIYANEVLWRAGIRPSRRASTLTRREREAVHREVVAVLREAVAARGTSIRDYRDAFGARGNFAMQLQAYGRAGQPCARCGAPLKSSHAISGRATVWCGKCQR